MTWNFLTFPNYVLRTEYSHTTIIKTFFKVEEFFWLPNVCPVIMCYQCAGKVDLTTSNSICLLLGTPCKLRISLMGLPVMLQISVLISSTSNCNKKQKHIFFKGRKVWISTCYHERPFDIQIKRLSKGLFVINCIPSKLVKIQIFWNFLIWCYLMYFQR